MPVEGGLKRLTAVVPGVRVELRGWAWHSGWGQRGRWLSILSPFEGKGAELTAP